MSSPDLLWPRPIHRGTWAFAWAATRSSALACALAVSACTSPNMEQTLARTNQRTGAFTQGELVLARNDAQRAAMDRAAADLLAQPLTRDNAVRLALLNSPALQALLAQYAADAAQAAQSGRIANPQVSLERLVLGSELEIGRSISFGLLDLLTLPRRQKTADAELARQELELAASVVAQVTQVRQAWVRAVAAQQNLAYAAQVQESAQASAELARRMQAACNFTRLQRAREHAFYADAMAQWATAQHAQTATREALVRALGLGDAQAAAMQLPARLPELPAQTITPQAAAQSAAEGRLDIRLAQAALQVQAAAQGLENISSLGDIELGLRADTVFDNAAATTTARTGVQLSVRVPVLDPGDQRRAAMNARTLAAAQNLQAAARAAGSHLRESYSAYRTAWDVAAHYRDDILPTQQRISEENLLRYNGMLIGVFELLADARAQTASVMGAITALEQFWLAEAALQSTLIGQPQAYNPPGNAAGTRDERRAAH